jgi:lipopolysaccharide export system permease protein
MMLSAAIKPTATHFRRFRVAMRILKYLARDIFSHTFAVALVLFLVVFSGRFIRYLAEAAVGDLSSDVLFPVMFYKLPSFFELILPLALFIGILLSLGRLYAESEMVVLKACGVSANRLAAYTLIPAVTVALMVGLLSLWIAPDGSAKAQSLLDNPRSAEGLQVMAPGRFKKQRNGDYVTYAERIGENGIMHNVFIVERERQPTGDRLSVTFAGEGELLYDDETGRRYLELREGTRFRGRPGSFRYEGTRFARYGELIPEREGGIRQTLRIDAIPTLTLWQSDDPAHKAALMWRLSLPLFVPIIAVIALALSRTDARRGRYARLGPALMVFLAYFLVLNQFRALIEDGGKPALMLLAHLLFAGVALALLHWERISKLAKRVKHRA